MVKLRDRLAHPRFPLIAMGIAVFLCLPALRMGLVIDDYWHRVIIEGGPGIGELFGPGWEMFSFTDGDAERTQNLMDLGILPWWTLPELVVNFWRPVTVATHWLDYQLWPDAAWAMHLQSLAWLAGTVLIAGLLYRRVEAVPWVAGLAVLLYAVDDARAAPASWVANRNALVASVFALGAIWLHMKWRQENKAWAGALAVIALAVGLLAKEEALATCAYLFAFAVFLDKGNWRSRAASLLPYVVLVVAWRLYYQHAGYGADGSGIYIDPGTQPWQFAVAVVRRLPVILLGQWSLPPADAYLLLSPTRRVALTLGSIAFLIVLAWVLRPLLRGNPAAKFWCLGMVLAAVPTCTTFPTDRLLIYIGLGGMGLCATFLAAWRDGRYDGMSRPLRLTAKVLFGWFVLIHLILSPLMLPGRIVVFRFFGQYVNEVIDSAEFDDSITDKTIVTVNSPTLGVTTYLSMKRTLERKPIPAVLRNLAPNVFKGRTITLERTGENTVVMRPSSSYPIGLFRDPAHALQAGDTVALGGSSPEQRMTVRVLRVENGGWPTEVEFAFDVPLEHKSLVWLQVEGARLVPFELPSVGETVTLPEPPTLRELVAERFFVDGQDVD